LYRCLLPSPIWAPRDARDEMLLFARVLAFLSLIRSSSVNLA
jgi:hypothetical protein